jgi:geranyl-CoA carboxylase alpha subunit
LTFRKILVANRGEIAVRVCRTAHQLGYRTVAVYSEADRDAPHVHAADEAWFIGPSPALESYLNEDALLDVAQRCGAEAVHPGYGFLSEQARFARACRDRGLVFIGPSPESIEVMGNKQKARELMQASGVPLVPGYQGLAQDDETLAREAMSVGFPLMVKAASGGGGKGMRVVARMEDLPDALSAARAEARNAFGDDRMILEKSVPSPRHVEIQIVMDQSGDGVHMGERDCSVQRRFQKIVEEAPSPIMDERLRESMGKTALAVARSVGYEGVGTVEFLLDQAGDFFFLEMNTRLQVEHAVTEAVTGLDLVALQFKIAAGEPLGIKQEAIKLRGHVVEVRLYAEDPSQDFLPRTGKILRWQVATLPGVRTDHAVAAGEEITSHYDPMMAKIVAHGADRRSAIRLLRRALEETVCLGVTHNQEFLGRVLDHPVFLGGEATTAFVDTYFKDKMTRDTPPVMWLLAAVLFYRIPADRYPSSLRGFCNVEMLPPVFIVNHDNQQKPIRVHLTDGNTFKLEMDQESYILELISINGARVCFDRDGVSSSAVFALDNHELHLKMGDLTRVFRDDTLAPPAKASVNEASGERITAAMSGRVVSVSTVVGAKVKAGTALVVLESMKMQHRLATHVNGVVRSIRVVAGQQVGNGDVLLELDVEGPA